MEKINEKKKTTATTTIRGSFLSNLNHRRDQMVSMGDTSDFMETEIIGCLHEENILKISASFFI